ncbi:hypothetical protein ACE939_02900 [Aquimarina sp. W85]|uniref:hypothetical protein n=1 Tax=Aquimarina rhodophyticola TaxID=3342246 RepID=UPI003670A691
MEKKIPKKCITVDEAKELERNWCGTRGKDIERCMKFQDTREFYYTVEELEEYLAYVKEKSLEQGIKDPGIRIYFGAYPQQKCKHKHGYSTIFLAPTGSPAQSLGKDGASAANNYSIEPFNRGGGGNPPQSY